MSGFLSWMSNCKALVLRSLRLARHVPAHASGSQSTARSVANAHVEAPSRSGMEPTPGDPITAQSHVKVLYGSAGSRSGPSSFPAQAGLRAASGLSRGLSRGSPSKCTSRAHGTGRSRISLAPRPGLTTVWAHGRSNFGRVSQQNTNKAWPASVSSALWAAPTRRRQSQLGSPDHPGLGGADHQVLAVWVS